MSDKLERLLRLSPHNRFLDLRIASVNGKTLTTKMEYRLELASGEAGVLHSGVVTSMLDATCSAAVLLKLGALTRVTTLELRIDTLQPSAPEHSLYCECSCSMLSREMAIVYGLAYHQNPDRSRVEIAKAIGTFLLPMPKPGASL